MYFWQWKSCRKYISYKVTQTIVFMQLLCHNYFSYQASCIVCDWLKDDVERRMLKDSCYAHNAESGYNAKII